MGEYYFAGGQAIELSSGGTGQTDCPSCIEQQLVYLNPARSDGLTDIKSYPINTFPDGSTGINCEDASAKFEAKVDSSVLQVASGDDITIQVTVRRNTIGDNAGFNARYMSDTGVFTIAFGWITVPDDDQWHTYSASVTDAKFLSTDSAHIRLDSDSIGFSDFSIRDIRVFKTGAVSDEYLELPELQPTDEVFYYLIDVNDLTDGTQIGITPKADALVDFGDGESQTAPANTLLTYSYDYTNPLLNGTLMSNGSKQSIITVTPVTPGTLTEITHSSYVNNIPSPIKKASIAGPAVNKVTFESVVRLEKLTIQYTQNLSNINRLASYCGFLKSVILDYSNITTANSAFVLTSLSGYLEINAPMLTTASHPFAEVKAIESIKLIAPLLTDASGFFNGLNAFFVDTDLSGSTDNTSLFNGCNKLQRIKIITYADFSVAGTRLFEAGLNEMFTHLPDVSSTGGATVTVNSGRGQDNTIATAKGWTVLEV